MLSVNAGESCAESIEAHLFKTLDFAEQICWKAIDQSEMLELSQSRSNVSAIVCGSIRPFVILAFRISEHDVAYAVLSLPVAVDNRSTFAASNRYRREPSIGSHGFVVN